MNSILAAVLATLLIVFGADKDFLAEQKKFYRVRTAISEKEMFVAEKLKAFNINVDELDLLIVALKAEEILELYAKRNNDVSYVKIATYNICSSSGDLGPKRKQGDNQVPEGFYHIDRFNPSSNFYLSLGVSYPNESDKRKSKFKNLGGDIFIHGSCVTIGCLPMTNEKIKEIYLFAVHAKHNGQSKIPVYIFPYRMSEKNFNEYQKEYKDNSELISFWKNLKTGYEKFDRNKKELMFKIDEKGNYVFY